MTRLFRGALTLLVAAALAGAATTANAADDPTTAGGSSTPVVSESESGSDAAATQQPTPSDATTDGTEPDPSTDLVESDPSTDAVESDPTTDAAQPGEDDAGETPTTTTETDTAEPVLELAVPGPAIEIVTTDSEGNRAETGREQVELMDGETGLVFTVTNVGEEELGELAVANAVVTGGAVEDLACAFPDGSTGTAWDGPFAAGETFACTADLTGIPEASKHHDIATVTAVGAVTGAPVTDDDPYHAIRPGIGEAVTEVRTPITGTAAVLSASQEAADAPELADTGANPWQLTVAALGLLIVGTALLLMRRRHELLG